MKDLRIRVVHGLVQQIAEQLIELFRRIEALLRFRQQLTLGLNAGGLYGFQVVSVQMLQGKQVAPLVVVRTSDKNRFRSSLGAILAVVNPTTRTGKAGPGDTTEPVAATS